MARIIREKELENTRLATSYGGGTYCTECGENIGYLCYATYDKWICSMDVSAEVTGT